RPPLAAPLFPYTTLFRSPRRIVHDQVDIALAVAQLLVLQAVVLVRQRAQRLGQQLGRFDVNVEIALARLVYRAGDADDIADIPADRKSTRLNSSHVSISY